MAPTLDGSVTRSAPPSQAVEGCGFPTTPSSWWNFDSIYRHASISCNTLCSSLCLTFQHMATPGLCVLGSKEQLLQAFPSDNTVSPMFLKHTVIYWGLCIFPVHVFSDFIIVAWPEPVQEGVWLAEEIREGVGLMGVTGEGWGWLRSREGAGRWV